jgi:hypothetical protein
MFRDEWPEGRLFLVVSDEFAERLRKPSRAWLKGEPPYCRWTPNWSCHHDIISTGDTEV